MSKRFPVNGIKNISGQQDQNQKNMDDRRVNYTARSQAQSYPKKELTKQFTRVRGETE